MGDIRFPGGHRKGARPEVYGADSVISGVTVEEKGAAGAPRTVENGKMLATDAVSRG